jgi:hypothetical protein
MFSKFWTYRKHDSFDDELPVVEKNEQVVSSPTTSVTTTTTDGVDGQYHIIILLDESGSMFDIKDDIIGSVNSFLDEQKKLDMSSNDLISLYKFSSECRPVFKKLKIVDVRNITAKDYVPRGNTALFDAIGAAVTTNSSSKNVMLVIVTDGLENASREFGSMTTIKNMLKDMEERNNWKTVYLSSDIDSFKQGTSMGISSTPSGVRTSTNNRVVKYSDLAQEITTTANKVVSTFRTTGDMRGI